MTSTNVIFLLVVEDKLYPFEIILPPYIWVCYNFFLIQ